MMASQTDPLLQGLGVVESDLPAFSRWMFDEVKEHLGSVVLDAGAGVGTYSRFILDSGRAAVAVEPEPAMRAQLVHNLGHIKGFRLLDGGLIDPEIVEKAGREGVDSAICLNVLEHIPEDRIALQHLQAILPLGGRLALLVPAHPLLFNTIDRSIGHVRRYRKRELMNKVEEAGLVIERLVYFNAFAIPGWVLSGHLLKRSVAGRSASQIFDRLVPAFRAIERLVLRGRVGISLIAICRRPEAAESRSAHLV